MKSCLPNPGILLSERLLINFRFHCIFRWIPHQKIQILQVKVTYPNPWFLKMKFDHLIHLDPFPWLNLPIPNSILHNYCVQKLANSLPIITHLQLNFCKNFKPGDFTENFFFTKMLLSFLLFSLTVQEKRGRRGKKLNCQL